MSEITPKGLKNLHAYMVKKYGHMGQDRTRRYENIIDYGYERLCDQCNGTTNQLMSMYQLCEKCKGTGIKEEPQE